MSNGTATQGYDTDSPLYRTTHTTQTDYWNDSCASEELAYAIRNGAVGATTNPSIVLNVLKKEHAAWKGVIADLIGSNPTASEEQIAWLAHKILQNSLNQMFGYDYLITGTWDDPKVEKLSKTAPAGAMSAPGVANEPAR